ncbi:MAG: hypothetical protein H7315_05085 [Herminiimonas sp.]|nr:hypothetical protein [Herminiimonas sp.]
MYDEIMLLDLDGNVLMQIDDTSPAEAILDPLIAQSLALMRSNPVADLLVDLSCQEPQPCLCFRRQSLFGGAI